MPCPDKYDILGNDHAGNPPTYGKPDAGTIVEVGDPATGEAPNCGWWNLHATPNLQAPVLM